MTIVEIIFGYIGLHPILVSFLGGIFGGEEVMVLLAMLSKQGILTFWSAFIFFTLGVYIMDALVFLFAKSRFIDSLFKRKRFANAYKRVSFLINKTTKNRVFVPLLISKALYGTGVAMLFYLGREKMEFSKFLKYNLGVVLILVSVSASAGMLLGEALIFMVKLFKSLQLALGVMLMLLILFFAFEIEIKKWIKQNLIKKRRR